ncbi:MAG: NAD(P)H-binding protein [Thermosynechococcaceae cyanobacterium]
MKLLIFGATGSIGRHVVEQALEQDHTVTAFVRNPAKLDIQHTTPVKVSNCNPLKKRGLP